LLLFRNIHDPEKTKWPPKKNGLLIRNGVYPCDLALFAKHLPNLRKIFQVDEAYAEEARQR
jgi:hypothetical protein